MNNFGNSFITCNDEKEAWRETTRPFGNRSLLDSLLAAMRHDSVDMTMTVADSFDNDEKDDIFMYGSTNTSIILPNRLPQASSIWTSSNNELFYPPNNNQDQGCWKCYCLPEPTPLGPNGFQVVEAESHDYNFLMQSSDLVVDKPSVKTLACIDEDPITTFSSLPTDLMPKSAYFIEMESFSKESIKAPSSAMATMPYNLKTQDIKSSMSQIVSPTSGNAEASKSLGSRLTMPFATSSTLNSGLFHKSTSSKKADLEMTNSKNMEDSEISIKKVKFRYHHFDQWKESFQDLMDFKKQHGHCMVPNVYPPNPKLAQWVKRNRYQYKLKESNRHSCLTEERLKELEEIGFVWESHKAAWMEQYKSLQDFYAKHGHCNVPSNCSLNRSLSFWVKCQRRQYRLYRRGKRSTMKKERIQALNELNFDWKPRGF